MTLPFDVARLIRRARLAAGLSQRVLARRAGTAQSVVSRVESGRTNPGSVTVARLLEAAGYELHVDLRPLPVLDSHMLADAARILRLSPEARLIEVANISRFVTAARRV